MSRDSRLEMLTGGVVRRVGVHQVKSRSDIVTLTLSSKDNVALVVGTT